MLVLQGKDIGLNISGIILSFKIYINYYKDTLIEISEQYDKSGRRDYSQEYKSSYSQEVISGGCAWLGKSPAACARVSALVRSRGDCRL